MRVAAIDFLNPAPLMWDLTHDPLQTQLRTRYDIRRMLPAECARQVLTGEADLGLIPVAALTGDLAVVPGCVIASLGQVRSIVLIVKGGLRLEQVRTVAADTASRSSVAYAQVLFRHFLGVDPEFLAAAADPVAMLEHADAALVIGDPALLARERKIQIEAVAGPCAWFDVAEEWVARTGLPWVAAVWAVRPQAVQDGAQRRQLIEDLNGSRDHGLAHIEDLVAEWTPQIALPAEIIRKYLTENIYYRLDARCVEAIGEFRRLAAKVHALPELPELRFLEG